MFSNKEQIKLALNEFYKNVDEIIMPYFSQFGYTKKILRGRCIVLFEKMIEEKYIQSVDFFCYAKYGMKAFRVTFNSAYKYLYTIQANGSKNTDIPWKYQDEMDLKDKLNETIRIIKNEKILELIDFELIKRAQADSDESKLTVE